MKSLTMTLIAVATLALAACGSNEPSGYYTFGKCAEGEVAVVSGRTTFCEYQK